MKKLLSLILVLALALSLVACGGNSAPAADAPAADAPAADAPAAEAPAGGTIRIAFVGPQTGDNAEHGQQMKAAIQVAIQQWNDKGGILGKTIVLDDYDDKNDSQEAGTIAEKIVSNDEYVAVIGHFSSGVAMTAAEIYQEAGIPLINGSAAHTDYSSIGDCIFRNNAMYTVDASSALQIMEHFGYTKFASIQPNSDAGVSINACLDTYLEDYGSALNVEKVAVELYEDGTVDFSAAINKCHEAGTEIVYTTAPYSIVAPLLKQYKAINPDIKFILSSGAFSQEFLDLAGEDANGVYVPNSFFYESSREATQQFTAAFNAHYGSNPSTFAAQCYDAANMIFLAIEAGQSDARADIVENLYKVEFDGASGKIVFDEIGDVPKQQVCLTVENMIWTEIPDVLLSPVDWAAELGF